MVIYTVGPGETYTTIASALTVIAGLSQPLTEDQQIEVKDGITPEAITIPGAIQPTAVGKLNIVNVDFNRPVVLDVTLDKPYTQFSGFETGDMTVGEDQQYVGENVVRGTLSVIGDGATSWTMKVVNNQISDFTDKGLVLKDLRGAIKVAFNSVLAYSEIIDPIFALEIDESDVEMKQNIFAAYGTTPNTKIVRHLDTSGRTHDFNRNLYWLYEQATFGVVDVGAGEVEIANIGEYQAVSEGPDSFFEDPIFNVLKIPSNLDVANASPAVAAGDFDSDVDIDIDKTRRPKLEGQPLSSTTLGAYEEAERITVAGKTRLLELLGGLSTDYISQAAVGDKGTVSAAEYLQPETVSDLDEELKNQIFITGRVRGYRESDRAVFEVLLGPEPRLTQELLDSIIDTMSEVGLIAADGILFLRRTLQRIPFDPLGNVTTRIVFRVAIVGEDITPPVLTITAEAA